MNCRKKDRQPKAPKPQTAKLSELLRYMNTKTKVIFAFGCAFSFISGGITPAFAIVIGKVINAYNPQNTPDQIHDAMVQLLKFIAIISAFLFVTSYLQYAFMQHAAEQFTSNLRALYLR